MPDTAREAPVRPISSSESDSAELPRIAGYLFIGSLIAILMVLAVAASTLWQSRQDAWKYAERSSDNLLQSIIGFIDQHVRLYSLGLELAADALSDPKFAALPEEAKQNVLTAIAANTDYVGSVTEIDANGNPVRSSIAMPTGANFADRDYFTVHRDSPNRGLYISSPFHSRVRDGDPVFALSRRLSDPDDGFAGVIVTIVRLAYVEAFFSTIDVGPKGALLLIGADGRILARHPPREGRGGVGTDLSQSYVFRRIEEMGAGSLVATAVVDGVERYYTFAHVPGQPLIVNLALSTDDIFEAWWWRTAVIGAITLLTCALILLLAILLRRELYRRMHNEADLARLSVTDALTGLANRRRYDEVMLREWRRTGRTGAPLSLLLLDVDGFKNLNDQHGHALGDEVLKTLAGVINACIRRPSDIAARYGGEEFAVVLPDTTEQGALFIAEKIRSACEKLDTGLPRITVSIGVKAGHPRPAQRLDEFQEAADKALYQAKTSGRNQVVLAP